MSPATLQGFVCARPHGYAGDFEIIDRIYQKHISADPRFAPWDAYFQSRSASQAVRNRKTYFHELLKLHSSRCRPLRVLKLASGPGRSMFEWLTVHPDADVSFHCVELDPKAIAFARNLNQAFLNRITFQQQNVIRFRPPQQYDLIWAAGLFDYFDDRVFQMVLSSLIPAIAPGGELVIGNFSTANPSRCYMEFGGWNLYHRTPETLETLAINAGANGRKLSVGSEPEGVNLFLHVANDAETK
jgi:SAM-dependent methyltransferase